MKAVLIIISSLISITCLLLLISNTLRTIKFMSRKNSPAVQNVTTEIMEKMDENIDVFFKTSNLFKDRSFVNSYYSEYYKTIMKLAKENTYRIKIKSNSANDFIEKELQNRAGRSINQYAILAKYMSLIIHNYTKIRTVDDDYTILQKLLRIYKVYKKEESEYEKDMIVILRKKISKEDTT